MNLKNPFSPNTRNLYLYEYQCWVCSRSDKGLELHHIYGRLSNSPYNGAVCCMECHSHMGHSREEHRELLMKAVRFLNREGYRPSREDAAFLSTVRDDLDSLLSK